MGGDIVLEDAGLPDVAIGVKMALSCEKAEDYEALEALFRRAWPGGDGRIVLTRGETGPGTTRWAFFELTIMGPGPEDGITLRVAPQALQAGETAAVVVELEGAR